ncbi:tumor protein p73-like [Lethenteron reissneri]|uniref:tumor protein p73-like n=1 Tax=Lethenteron reissneri TaxID=7753 RepID=UPI002AB7289C|nr:tumor protein p73-like [Lethenteron reissneri]
MIPRYLKCGQVLGRFCCETRVCASPGRDIKMDERCMHHDDEELQQQQSPNNWKAPSLTMQNAAQYVQQYPPALAEAATQTCQSPQAQPVEHTPQVPKVSSGSSQRASGEAASDTNSQGCVKVVHDMLMTESNCGSNWPSDQKDIFHLLVHGREHFEILKKIKESLELVRMLPKDVVNVLRNLQQQRYVTELRGRPFNLSRHGSECSQEVLAGSQGPSSAGEGSSPGVAQNVVTGEASGSNGPPRPPDGDNPPARLGTLPDSGKPGNALYNFLKQIDCLEFLENFTSRGLSSVQQLMDVTLQDLDELGVPEAKKRLLLSGIEEHGVSTTISSETTLQRSSSEETVHLSSEDDDDDGIDTKDGILAKVFPALRPSGRNLSSVGNRYRKSSIAKYNLRAYARQAVALPRAGSWGGSSSLEVPRSKMPKFSSCSDIEEEEGLE